MSAARIRRVAGIYLYWRAIWAQRQMVVGGERARSPHPSGAFLADVASVATKGEVKIEENRLEIGEEFKAHQDIMMWKLRHQINI
jgi:hypothetical protein